MNSNEQNYSNISKDIFKISFCISLHFSYKINHLETKFLSFTCRELEKKITSWSYIKLGIYGYQETNRDSLNKKFLKKLKNILMNSTKRIKKRRIIIWAITKQLERSSLIELFYEEHWNLWDEIH